MGFYLNKVVIMSNNKELYGNSYKELKVQLTDINEEFGKEMVKNNFNNYLEYVSNGDSLDQGRKIRKHEREVRKTLKELLKFFDEEDVIEIVDGIKFILCQGRKETVDEKTAGRKKTAGEVMESFCDKRNILNEEEENMTNDNGDVIASLESYDVTGKGRFLAFIQEKFENSSWDRKGASEDSKKLKDLADFLGYKYVEHRDLKKEEIKDVLKRAAEETDKETVGSCLICAISSHGNEDDEIFTKCTSRVPLVDFVEPFSDTKCESLRGKPKVFIVQACRGRKEEKDGNYYTPPKINTRTNFRDMVFACATIPDHVSVRNETTGSHYISNIVEAFKAGRNEEIQKVLTLANSKTSRKQSKCSNQMSCFRCNLEKQLYLC